MLLWTTIKVAWRSLLGNKLRSLLAILGIIIGVAAVISMLALGAGAQKNVVEQINSMGTDLLVIRPGGHNHRGVRTDRQSLKLEDAQAILELPEVKEISPVVNSAGQVKYLNKNSQISFMGVAQPYLSIRNFELASGRFFSERETEARSNVCIVGAQVIEELFEGADPLGEMIRVRGRNFTVIGTLKAKGDQGWFNMDNLIMMPYTTVMKNILGQDNLREINLVAWPGTDLTALEEKITLMLRKRHRLTGEMESDFNIRNQAELLSTMSNITGTFTILLGGIAGISLLVGGIGIMNIMLVTVTERTREIGIRKAIGARDRDVLSQFLIEAILISFSGGVIGALAGVGIAWAIEHFTGFRVEVEMVSIVVALLFSASVGIFFGYYPAHRAAKLSPCDALRYE